MKILIVSVEVSPFAKVGGLADVAGALPKALRALGHDARVVMPLYRMIEEDPRWNLVTGLDPFEVQMNPHWKKTATFKQTEFDGVPIGFIGTDEWFTESVNSETVYQPGGMQHLFFSTAVLKAMEALDWIPDVVHCNDWHTGFLPVIMRERASGVWDDVASVYTIHNLAYQGEFGLEVLDALELPHSLYTPDKLETWGRVNFLKAGCAFSDQVNTVSENYARETQTAEYGCTLEGLMQYLHRQGRLSGIVNGIDKGVFDPETDPDIPSHFSSRAPEGKAACRTALLEELGLQPIEGAPVMGVVSRLSSQKGIDLIVEAAEALFELPAQLIIQGLGDPSLAGRLRELEQAYPTHFRFIERFDAPMAQRVYAGCDMFLMPSSFEPCGLGQLIALRYGTVPVVRATGGLADTVFEGQNGFVFKNRSAMELLAAVERAHDRYQNSEAWDRLVQTGLSGEYGWEKSAVKYVELYERACKDRERLAVCTA
jgi:starch synthase